LDRSIAGWRQRTGLRARTDYAGTEERVRDGAVLSAWDLWLVPCSAGLASIGLDLDSVTVIIGAALVLNMMYFWLPPLSQGVGTAAGSRARERGVRP
jgi:hypothetical protein